MSDQFTPEEIEILARYVTNPTGSTFCVNMPGLAGIIYARYSRAVTGLRRTLLKEFVKDGKLNVERTQELIERILNEYGDDSVGELEGAHLALEQISNLVTKIVEDARIGGSPIEQSTRYVFYDQKDAAGYKYYRGPEILNSSLGGEYTAAMDLFFDAYAGAVVPLTEYFRKRKPLEEAEYEVRVSGQRERYSSMDSEVLQKQFRITYNADLRTKACDVLRCLLPAATLTNVGLFGNGRFYQALLSRLYTNTLEESRRRAAEGHEELNKVIPKFVKRARLDDYQTGRNQQMEELAGRLLKNLPQDSGEECSLLPPAANAAELLERTLALCLYPYSRHPLSQLISVVRQLAYDERQSLLLGYAGGRKTRRDRPGRAFECGYPLTFEIQADFGAYRDLQRHRMVTQERQLLNPSLGYDMPEELDAIGLKKAAIECFDRSSDLHHRMEGHFGRETAQYAVLFGYKIRWMMGMNFREAMHLIELRTTPQGHPSYRKICQNMMDRIKTQHPELASTFRFVDYNDYYWSRADSEARQRVKERALDEKYSPSAAADHEDHED